MVCGLKAGNGSRGPLLTLVVIGLAQKGLDLVVQCCAFHWLITKDPTGADSTPPERHESSRRLIQVVPRQQ